MPVAKPIKVPRWATASPSSIVEPPDNVGAIGSWAQSTVYPNGSVRMANAVQWVSISHLGTGTSLNSGTGPSGAGPTFVDNPGANQITWSRITTTPITKDSGWIPNIQPPAQYFNWMWNLVYLWILWLQDIANQDFTGSGVGPWAGPHLFTGGNGIGNPAVKIVPTVANTNGLEVHSAGNQAALYAAPNGTNAIGVSCEGNGTGSAISAIANGNAPAGYFECDGVGPGVRAVGGSASPAVKAEGQDGPGVQAIGSPGQPGLVANPVSGNADGATLTASGTGNGCTGQTSGSGAGCSGVSTGSGPAVRGTSVFGNGQGGSFTATGTGAAVDCANSGSGVALDVGAGHANFSATPPAITANPGHDGHLSKGNIVRAQGHLRLIGGVLTITDGLNVASASVNGIVPQVINVQYARPIGSAGAGQPENYTIDIFEDNNQGTYIRTDPANKTQDGFSFSRLTFAGSATNWTTGGVTLDLNFVVYSRL